jgi:DNA-binding beta-propeller fold protein YncE
MRRKLLKVVGGVLLFLAVSLAGGWLAFVPSAVEPGYEFVMAWGGPGDGPGRFNDPTGIAIAGSEVFVSDARNRRIQVFDLDGAFKRAFGEDRLGRPMNLTIAKGELYVADYRNDRIEVFSLDGEYIRGLGTGGGGPGEFNAPGGIAVAPGGDLYVADFYNQRVQHLRADGGYVGQWGTTGEVTARAGGFNYPTAVALGRDGTLYVADGYNDRVQAFAPDGSFAGKWGGPFAANIYGPFNGWFATVTGIAVDGEGDVYVADFYNHRIQKFTADGDFLTAFGAPGQGAGEFNYAIAVAIAPDGAVFAADFGNNRIQKWRAGPE